MQEPIYRVAFDAGAILREHPLVFRHPHKAALFEIAYPKDAAPRGTIEVTRWAQRVDEPSGFRRRSAARFGRISKRQIITVRTARAFLPLPVLRERAGVRGSLSRPPEKTLTLTLSRYSERGLTPAPV
jgi:hypothetical protein